ncbi:ComF family protein [Stenotrophomonas sp. YIM B06876]|uniref:ComF family protein n=1 Tax=Stenotrophomonas sp. YIM B06876 TaxID=3060211 RepID=UPI002739C8EE|nr:ComF family protein [Stenotrophomonas sp. YIM B06876]
MISSKVYGWWSQLGRLLLPLRCLVCGEAGSGECDLCADCRATLPWTAAACDRCALPLPLPVHGGVATLCGPCLQQSSPLQQTRAAFVYGAPVDALVRRFKFHQDLAAGHLLSRLMAEPWRGAPMPQAIVPVPLHPARLRQRGYDQALELARPLARQLQLPLCHGLRRVRGTAPQSELDAGARRRNLKGAFVALPGVSAHVALLDDVMTTGATLHAAATALRRAGVQRVDAWVCARVP